MDGRCVHVDDGYDGNKDAARERTRQWAKRNGITVTHCELCGTTAADIDREHEMIQGRVRLHGMECDKRQRYFVGHHWRGYDYPEDVWWICYPCNGKLKGRHDGSLTKEQARQFVTGYFYMGYTFQDIAGLLALAQPGESR